MGINDFIKIGRKIKEARIAAKLTQKEMAKKLGLSVSTYSNYENEHREPPLEVIKSICDIVGTDLAVLILGTGIKQNNESSVKTLEVNTKNIKENPELFNNILREIINRPFSFFQDATTGKILDREEFTNDMLLSSNEKKAEFINMLVEKISLTKTGSTLSVHIDYKKEQD